MRRTLEAFRAAPARGRALVLEVDGVVAGYALLAAFWSNELGGEVCILDELYVAPQSRGQGHGASLIETLAAGQRQDLWPGRPAALALEAAPGNIRARALYERLGFSGDNAALVRRLGAGRI